MSDADLSGRSFLLRNVLVSWASQLLLVVTGFFLPRFIDQELGQSTLGIWDFAWSLVSYLNLTQLGIASSLSRFISSFRAEGNLVQVRRACSTVTVVQMALSTLILIVVGVVHSFIPLLFDAKESNQVGVAQATFLILGISIAVQFLFDTSRGILTGCHRWDIYNALYSSAQIVAVCIMIAAVLLGGGLITISLVYLSAITLECLIRVVLARRVCPEATFSAREFSPQFLRQILMFGAKMFTLNMGPLIVSQTVSVMIASSLGPALLAVFSRPSALVRFIQTFVTRFAFMLTPMAGPIRLAEGDQGLRAFAAACSRFGFAFTVPVMSLFCLYGDEVVRVWMGQEYVNQPLVVILGLGFVLPFSMAPLVRVIVGLDYHGPAAAISLFGSLVCLAIGSGLVFWSGPSLPSFAMVVACTMTLTNGIAIPLYACRRLSIDPLSFLLGAFGRVFGICLAPFAMILLLEWRFGFEGFAIIPSCVAYLVCVLTGYWFLLLEARHKRVVLDRLGIRTASAASDSSRRVS